MDTALKNKCASDIDTTILDTYDLSVTHIIFLTNNSSLMVYFLDKISKLNVDIQIQDKKGNTILH